jgi:hypothetical protein
MKRSLLFATIGLFAMINFSSCTEEVKENTFKVRMTDAPGNYAALNMQIVGIDAYLEDQGWVNLSSENQLVNVLTLTNGMETELVSNTKVSTGVYTKLRIRFADEATVVVNSSILGGGLGSNTTQTLTWDGPSEAEIVIHEEVSANAGADILLDFHVAQSVYENAGEYFINPAVTVIEDASTGAQGSVQGTLMAAVTLFNGQHTYSTYINATGQFLIRGIEPGVYEMVIQPTEQGLQEQHISNVVIIRGEIKQLGSIQM